MMEWPFGDSVTVLGRWQYLAELWQGFAGGCICSESVYNIWFFFSFSQDSWIQESGVEMELAPLTITPSGRLAKFLLPLPVTLCSAGLEVLVPTGEIVPPGDTIMIPLTHQDSSLSSYPKIAGPWKASISASSFFHHRGQGSEQMKG